MPKPPRDWGIPDTYVFDHYRSGPGYRLNKLCASLVDPRNRDAFKADEEGYMTRYGLTPEQQRAVRERDWLGLVKLGGNIYYLMKIGACVGHGLYQIGAQQRGESYEDFLRTRRTGKAT